MINRNLKCFYLYKRHRMPICYLFSSKLILISSILILMYFLIMDCILFNKAKHRGPFINLDLNKDDILTNNHNIHNSSKLLSKLIQAASSTSLNSNHLNNHASGSIFWPLPVKKIMMADGTHYIRSPIAEFVEYAFSFSEIFPFISANFISFSHCVLSVVSIKFLINDNLFWRQFGVCIFQFRNFLDSFDGVIYRAHAKKSIYRSNYGSMGYFVDAFSDVFGGLCLIGSLAIFFLKHRPLNKKLTKCFRTACSDDQSPTTHTNNNNNNNNEHDLLSSNLETSSLSSSTSSLILNNNSNNQNSSSLPISPSSSNSPSTSQSPAYYSPSILYEKNVQFKNQ